MSSKVNGKWQINYSIPPNSKLSDSCYKEDLPVRRGNTLFCYVALGYMPRIYGYAIHMRYWLGLPYEDQSADETSEINGVIWNYRSGNFKRGGPYSHVYTKLENNVELAIEASSYQNKLDPKILKALVKNAMNSVEYSRL